MKLPRLDWPQTALVLGLGAIAVLALIYAPAEYHAPIGAALTLAVGVLRSIVASSPPPPPSDPGDADGPPTRPRRRPTIPPGATMALVLVLLAGCSPSALRTHQTIATIARVSVVAAHPAIVSACETLMSRCTDDACLERVGHDCEAAAVARDTAHAAVRAYVDTIQIAAHADEGRVAPALDLALSTLARVYDAAREAIARTTGYRLPELPPEALPILRALTAGAVEVLGGGS